MKALSLRSAQAFIRRELTAGVCRPYHCGYTAPFFAGAHQDFSARGDNKPSGIVLILARVICIYSAI